MTDEHDESLVGIVEVSRQEAQLLLEAGFIYMEMGKFQEAKDVFYGASSLLPRSDVPLIALGQMHMSQSLLDDAIKFYKAALKIRPDSATAHAFLGEAYLFKKKPELALPELKKAQDLDPEGPPSQLANSLLQAHNEGVFNS